MKILVFVITSLKIYHKNLRAFVLHQLAIRVDVDVQISYSKNLTDSMATPPISLAIWANPATAIVIALLSAIDFYLLVIYPYKHEVKDSGFFLFLALHLLIFSL